MYYLIVVAALVFGLPVTSIAVEMLVGNASVVFLVGKWFVFWSVGARLLVAGFWQVLNPAFTARTVFGTEDSGALRIVPGLGFGNVAIGVLGLASMNFQTWIMPAAVCGAIFCGLAAMGRLRNDRRNRMENIAFLSDAWIALVLTLYVAATILSGQDHIVRF